jgi:hypothetical protein
VVGFDTTILPGREGSITPEVNLAKAHGGTFSKCVTVSSNARNKPDLHLCVKMTLKVPLAANPDYIQMRRSKSGKFEVEITLSTDKPDLVVKEATFKSSQGTGPNQAAWLSSLPDHLMFTLTKPDKPAADGSWDYKLKLSEDIVDIKENRFGEFTIVSNHPDMPELKANGFIDVSVETKK